NAPSFGHSLHNFRCAAGPERDQRLPLVEDENPRAGKNLGPGVPSGQDMTPKLPLDFKESARNQNGFIGRTIN
ncbi:hypothetical protein, partial [Caballeronia arationis]|uniref:hypothetical protein n=1 Tax=Caballeronia arationis TaxID=1777142 RepID=UPI000A537A2E